MTTSITTPDELVIEIVHKIVALVVFLYLASKLKSPYGINFKAIKPWGDIKCPNCGSKLPKVRKPENLRQILWGGGTCRKCGKEYSKWFDETES